MWIITHKYLTIEAVKAQLKNKKLNQNKNNSLKIKK